MKIVYYNLQLGSYDGSNMHAMGMLNALEGICGKGNVFIANDFSKSTYNHKVSILKRKLSKVLKLVRIIRREVISKKNASRIAKKIQDENFEAEYLLARSVLYDKTPLFLAKKLGCKLIIEHNTPFFYECCYLRKTETEKSVKKYEQNILEHSDGVYVVSNILKDMLLSKYCNLQQNKMIAIPNGYMKNLFNHIDKEKQSIRIKKRKEYDVEKKMVVVFVGSLQKWHGIDKLLSVAKNMVNSKDIEFWILGDGEKRGVVEVYASQYDNLKWFGNVPFEELRDLLFASDLGIMPYESVEKFYFSPLKMYDMIGAALPFLGLSIGQIESICTSELGEEFLLNDTSPDEIISRIKFIKENKAYYLLMKEKIRNISNNHTWDTRAIELTKWMETL